LSGWRLSSVHQAAPEVRRADANILKAISPYPRPSALSFCKRGTGSALPPASSQVVYTAQYHKTSAKFDKSQTLMHWFAYDFS
jgi:hypothetical protein